MESLGGPTGQEVLDRLATMDRGAIPDDEELASDLAQQEAEKPHHIGAVIGLGLRLHDQALVGRDGRDRRAMIAGQGNPQDRGLPVPRPGADVMGKQVEPRLIHPDDHSSFVVGFFLSAGQRCSHQTRMASSLRWVARSMGRCTL